MKANKFKKQVEAFLDGKLSKEQEEVLKKEINNSSELRNTFNLMVLEHQTIDALIKEDLREKVENWKNNLDYIPPKPKFKQKKRKFNKWYLFTCLILIGLGAFLYINNLNGNNHSIDENTDSTDPLSEEDNIDPKEDSIIIDQSPIEAQEGSGEPVAKQDKTQDSQKPNSNKNDFLYIASNNIAEPKHIDLMGETEPELDSSQYTKIIKAYQNRDYSQVIDILEKYQNSIESDYYYNVLEYQGLSYFFTDDFENAIRIFDKISKGLSNSNIFTHRAKLNLALCYLAKGDLIQAKQKLLSISSDSNNNYQKEINELLKQLD